MSQVAAQAQVAPPPQPQPSQSFFISEGKSSVSRLESSFLIRWKYRLVCWFNLWSWVKLYESTNVAPLAARIDALSKKVGTGKEFKAQKRFVELRAVVMKERGLWERIRAQQKSVEDKNATDEAAKVQRRNAPPPVREPDAFAKLEEARVRYVKSMLRSYSGVEMQKRAAFLAELAKSGQKAEDIWKDFRIKANTIDAFVRDMNDIQGLSNEYAQAIVDELVGASTDPEKKVILEKWADWIFVVHKDLGGTISELITSKLADAQKTVFSDACEAVSSREEKKGEEIREGARAFSVMKDAWLKSPQAPGEDLRNFAQKLSDIGDFPDKKRGLFRAGIAWYTTAWSAYLWGVAVASKDMNPGPLQQELKGAAKGFLDVVSPLLPQEERNDLMAAVDAEVSSICSIARFVHVPKPIVSTNTGFTEVSVTKVLRKCEGIKSSIDRVSIVDKILVSGVLDEVLPILQRWNEGKVHPEVLTKVREVLWLLVTKSAAKAEVIEELKTFFEKDTVEVQCLYFEFWTWLEDFSAKSAGAGNDSNIQKACRDLQTAVFGDKVGPKLFKKIQNCFLRYAGKNLPYNVLKEMADELWLLVVRPGVQPSLIDEVKKLINDGKSFDCLRLYIELSVRFETYEENDVSPAANGNVQNIQANLKGHLFDEGAAAKVVKNIRQVLLQYVGVEFPPEILGGIHDLLWFLVVRSGAPTQVLTEVSQFLEHEQTAAVQKLRGELSCWIDDLFSWNKATGRSVGIQSTCKSLKKRVSNADVVDAKFTAKLLGILTVLLGWYEEEEAPGKLLKKIGELLWAVVEKSNVAMPAMETLKSFFLQGKSPTYQKLYAQLRSLSEDYVSQALASGDSAVIRLAHMYLDGVVYAGFEDVFFQSTVRTRHRHGTDLLQRVAESVIREGQSFSVPREVSSMPLDFHQLSGEGTPDSRRWFQSSPMAGNLRDTYGRLIVRGDSGSISFKHVPKGHDQLESSYCHVQDLMKIFAPTLYEKSIDMLSASEYRRLREYVHTLMIGGAADCNALATLLPLFPQAGMIMSHVVGQSPIFFSCSNSKLTCLNGARFSAKIIEGDTLPNGTVLSRICVPFHPQKDPPACWTEDLVLRPDPLWRQVCYEKLPVHERIKILVELIDEGHTHFVMATHDETSPSFMGVVNLLAHPELVKTEKLKLLKCIPVTHGRSRFVEGLLRKIQSSVSPTAQGTPAQLSADLQGLLEVFGPEFLKSSRTHQQCVDLLKSLQRQQAQHLVELIASKLRWSKAKAFRKEMAVSNQNEGKEVNGANDERPVSSDAPRLVVDQQKGVIETKQEAKEDSKKPIADEKISDVKPTAALASLPRAQSVEDVNWTFVIDKEAEAKEEEEWERCKKLFKETIKASVEGWKAQFFKELDDVEPTKEALDEKIEQQRVFLGLSLMQFSGNRFQTTLSDEDFQSVVDDCFLELLDEMADALQQKKGAILSPEAQRK